MAGLKGDEPDTMPFLFTRNVAITTEDIRNWPASSERIPLDAKVLPFGKEEAIVISKGGTMTRCRARKFRWNAVFSTTNRYDYLEVWDVE